MNKAGHKPAVRVTCIEQFLDFTDGVRVGEDACERLVMNNVFFEFVADDLAGGLEGGQRRTVFVELVVDEGLQGVKARDEVFHFGGGLAQDVCADHETCVFI